jgi:molybdopterin-guanine dinucleotide biosynthesis protein A
MNSVTNTLNEKNLTSNIPLNTTCLGVVLAGGLSSRMGENKADLAHFADHQRSMLNYSQQTLKNSGIHHIVVSSAYQASSISGIAESTVNHQHQVNDKFKQLGPLAGIYSVIQQYQPQAILALPVDLPLLDQQALSQLKIAGELSGKAVFFEENYLPLYLPINVFTEFFLNKAFANIHDELNRSERGPSMRKLLEHVPHQAITLKKANVSALFNCNTPADWQQAKKLYCSTLTK